MSIISNQFPKPKCPNVPSMSHPFPIPMDPNTVWEGTKNPPNYSINYTPVPLPKKIRLDPMGIYIYIFIIKQSFSSNFPAISPWFHHFFSQKNQSPPFFRQVTLESRPGQAIGPGPFGLVHAVPGRKNGWENHGIYGISLGKMEVWMGKP